MLLIAAYVLIAVYLVVSIVEIARGDFSRWN
jgi:hypothetical protein